MGRRRGFSLLELLLVIAIIGVLIAIISPSLEKATERSRVAACSSNLHQIAIGFNTYASEFNSRIPVGPGSASSLDAARPWNTIGSHQLWIGSLASYDGMGGLVPGGWITDVRVFICPSDDDRGLKNNIKGMIGGTGDAWGSYAYRQMDQRSGGLLTTPGTNGVGNAARALVLDWQSAGPAPYAHGSHDTSEYLNVLYADGHIQYFPNDDRDFGGRDKDYGAMPGSYLKRLDQVWVNADWAETQSVDSAPKLP